MICCYSSSLSLRRSRRGPTAGFWSHSKGSEGPADHGCWQPNLLGGGIGGRENVRTYPQTIQLLQLHPLPSEEDEEDWCSSRR